MLFRWKTILSPLYIVISILISSAQTVEVRLNLGHSENQGRVEVRRDSKQTWGQVCDLHFGQLEADVVCKQLHYQYARHEKDVYIAKLADFVLENIHCKGGENDLSECIDGEWKVSTGQCNAQQHNYASVCCSNSPNFGEVRDGIFVSDCADFWLDAEENCESKMGILATGELYTKVLGIHDVSDKMKGFWTRMYFTPWLWSNGCFKISNTSPSSVSREFTVRNNSAQVCLQLCSIDKPTPFLLSGNTCLCLTESMKSSITEVFPGYCDNKCAGNTDTYCGNNVQNYWSYYSIASEENHFFRISDPLYKDKRQCAVTTTTGKLVTENCYKRRGYICGQVQNNGTLKLMHFKDNPFYEVTMQEAQQKCETSDLSMHLIGEQILSHDGIFFELNNMWVDLIRTLTAVYRVDTDTDSLRGSGRLRNLNPKWCLSRNLENQYYKNNISLCQEERLRYICSLDSDNAGTTLDSGSLDETTSGSTVFNPNHTVTNKHDHTSMTEPIQRLDIHSILTIIISVLCAVVLLVLIIVLIFCWFRRSAKKGKGPFVSFMRRPEQVVIDEHHETPQNEYLATLRGSESPEHIYNELDDHTKNIYNEVDTLLELIFNKPLPPEPIECEGNSVEGHSVNGSNLSDSLKEPVTMKRSYSSPKDLVQLVDTDDLTCFKDPSYTYPYDKVQRSDIICGENSDVPSEAKSDVPNEAKSNMQIEANSDVPSEAKSNVPSVPTLDITTDAQSASTDSKHTDV